jgi:hypothetical protein
MTWKARHNSQNLNSTCAIGKLHAFSRLAGMLPTNRKVFTWLTRPRNAKVDVGENKITTYGGARTELHLLLKLLNEINEPVVLRLHHMFDDTLRSYMREN